MAKIWLQIVVSLIFVTIAMGRKVMWYFSFVCHLSIFISAVTTDEISSVKMFVISLKWKTIFLLAVLRMWRGERRRGQLSWKWALGRSPGEPSSSSSSSWSSESESNSEYSESDKRVCHFCIWVCDWFATWLYSPESWNLTQVECGDKYCGLLLEERLHYDSRWGYVVHDSWLGRKRASLNFLSAWPTEIHSSECHHHCHPPHPHLHHHHHHHQCWRAPPQPQLGGVDGQQVAERLHEWRPRDDREILLLLYDC